MPSWKRVIVSGSAASLQSLYVSGSITGSSLLLNGTTAGSTLLDIQGTQGQLFSITDSLVGDIFAVSDISGIPILNVNSSGLVTVDGDLSVTGTLSSPTLSLSNLTDSYIPYHVNDSTGLVDSNARYGSGTFAIGVEPSGAFPLEVGSTSGGTSAYFAGKVGIGTTSSTGVLTAVSPDGSTNSLRLGRLDTGNYWDFNHAGGDLRIYNGAGTGSDILFGVTSGGIALDNSVGIGIASPSEKLHVNGTIYSTTKLRAGSTGTDGGLQLARGSDGAVAFTFGYETSTTEMRSNFTGGGGFYTWYTNYGGEVVERMRLSNSGNLGLGIASPTQKLHVSGNLLLDTNGYAALFSTYKGANSDGYNIFIGGGGQSSIGVVGETYRGSYNTSIGNAALQNNAVGFRNTAIGSYALQTNTTGSYNVAIGEQTLLSNQAGNVGIAIGVESQKYVNNTTVPWTNSNVSVGYQSLRGSAIPANNTGNENTAVGHQTLFSNNVGYANAVLGYKALFNNLIGNNNVGVGFSSLYSNVSGSGNTALGRDTLTSNVAGNGGIAIGYQSQQYVRDLTTSWGNTNTSIGYRALRGSTTPANNTGTGNTAVGHSSMAATTTGNGNTAIGVNTLIVNLTGAENTTVGTSGLGKNIAHGNTAVGYAALYENVLGAYNTALGSYAGRFIRNGTTPVSQSSYSVFLGNNAYPDAEGQTNQIVIGYNALGNGSNTVTLGNDSITKTILKGNVGIGTTISNGKLNFVGNTTTTIISSTRSDDTNRGFIKYNGWGSYSITGGGLSIGEDWPESVAGGLKVVGGTQLTGSLYVHSTAGNNPSILLSDADTTNRFTAVESNVKAIGKIQAAGSTTGGLLLDGYSSADAGGLVFRGLIGSTAPTLAPVLFRAGKWNGATNYADIAAGEKAFEFENIGATVKYLTILGSGNVGIGTTTPTAKLDVNGNTNITGSLTVTATTNGDAILVLESDTDNSTETDNPYILFRQDGGLVQGRLGLTSENNAEYFGAVGNSMYLNSTTGTVPLQLVTNNTASITIDSSQKVGIGTTSPSRTLDVIGPIRTSNGIIYGGSGNVLSLYKDNASAIGLRTNGILVGSSYDSDPNANEIRTPSNQNLTINTRGTGALYLQTADTTKITLLNNGNVGIGTLTPTVKLDVNGNTVISGSLTTTETIQMVSGSQIFFIANKTGVYTTSIGGGAGLDSTGITYANFIGVDAGVFSPTAHYANFIGYQAGYSASVAEYSNFLGFQTGFRATNADRSNFLGKETGFGATNAYRSNFLGIEAGKGAVDAYHSNFLGDSAGQNATSASYSTFLGYHAGYAPSAGVSLGAHNIIIGSNVSLPASTVGGLNIGGVLFGTGLNTDIVSSTLTDPISGGRIGIGIADPGDSKLYVYNNRETVVTDENPEGIYSFVNRNYLELGTTSNNLRAGYFKAVATNADSGGPQEIQSIVGVDADLSLLSTLGQSITSSLAATYTTSNPYIGGSTRAGIFGNFYGTPLTVDGTVGTYYDIYLPGIDPTSTGTVTNRYGIYQADGTLKNFFSGSVGIGTNSPKTRLHIYANSTGVTESLRLQGKYNALGDGTFIRFTNYHASGTTPNAGEYNLAGILGYDYDSNWGGGLAFQTASPINGGGALTTRMVISSTGNVGIGTTSPASKLDVNGNTIITGSLVLRTATSLNSISLYTENDTANIADTFADTSTDKSYIVFRAGDGSNDPGYIMHETSETETNEGVLHLCPSDDNNYGDYISIHGTNDADQLKLHTDGTIEGVLTLNATKVIATTLTGSLSGNATTATTLAAPKNINGTAFNGSIDITTANWGTGRTVTIGNTGKSVNGSTNISWTLAEIGAVPSTGGSITGSLSITGSVEINTGLFSSKTSANSPVEVYNVGTTGNTCAIVDYTVVNAGGTAQRSGTITCNFNNSAVTHTETSTPDLGTSTSAVTFTTGVGSGALRVYANITGSDTWTIKTSVRYF